MFCTCCQDFLQKNNTILSMQNQNTSNLPRYGSYLAGRVAHLRKDFDLAGAFYAQTILKDNKNLDLLGQQYIILASQGKIDEAAKYAKMSLELDNNSFVATIVAVHYIKNAQYEDAQKTLSSVQGDVYSNFITPLLLSWNAVGQNNQAEAFAQLKKLNSEPDFKTLYNFHMALVNDYFGNQEAAQKYFEIILTQHRSEVSFRGLQIITNFYVRSNQKEKALALVAAYKEDSVFGTMIKALSKNVQNADESKTLPLINSASDGMAEALFSIASTLRQGSQNIDLAHIFVSMSVYSNPNYDLAKLLQADILETRGLYNQANAIYDTINKQSEAYDIVLRKKANNYIALKNFYNAEYLLKEIIKITPDNYQAYLDLGDVLRVQGKHSEALTYYNKAFSQISTIDNQHWILYYAQGVSYERLGQWNKAETSLLKALELSENHYLVQNYLGYTWLINNQNIDKAFGLIVAAYNQMPNDGNIIDSLGYAFYQLGMYDDAIKYLEKATEIEPTNPIISEHLGDAYWYGGRKNEAVFQWNHALIMPDNTGEFKPTDVKAKISFGLPEPKVLSFDKKEIQAIIKNINNY